ncbi:unnamed protein product [Ilex paraguariensis]|uniref:Uncharacterized protein n=1 Tax=Ilex paraguariensis TaxID=185542 RepID=A0ABC8QM45_9AQUA
MEMKGVVQGRAGVGDTIGASEEALGDALSKVAHDVEFRGGVSKGPVRVEIDAKVSLTASDTQTQGGYKAGPDDALLAGLSLVELGTGPSTLGLDFSAKSGESGYGAKVVKRGSRGGAVVLQMGDVIGLVRGSARWLVRGEAIGVGANALGEINREEGDAEVIGEASGLDGASKGDGYQIVDAGVGSGVLVLQTGFEGAATEPPIGRSLKFSRSATWT